jgi:predicted AlkP superfamily pyrophosphatase or phosphodiesterase
VVLDGLPWRNWRRYMGNLEGWVASGDARLWRMRSVLPSTSASCYASIHTGVPPQEHGILSNDVLFRVSQPDIFSEVSKAGRRTGAVAHSFWSVFFNRAPFDPLRDIEYC